VAFTNSALLEQQVIQVNRVATLCKSQRRSGLSSH
jgi:hypothetical protein